MRLKSRILFYLLFSIVIITIHIFRPALNWDSIPYMLCTLNLEEHDFNKAHAKTYSILEREVSDVTFEKLTSEYDYRKTVMLYPEAFKEQLPYYSIKVFFIAIVSLLYQLGIPLTLATVLPSLLSVFLLIILIFNILEKEMGNTLIAGIISLILMCLPLMIRITLLSTPDALSTLLLTAIAIMYIKNINSIFIFFLMILCVTTRTDNIIWCSILLTIDAIRSGNNFRKYAVNIIQVLILFSTVFIINKILNNGGWDVLFYNTFIKKLVFPLSSTPDFTLSQYLWVLVQRSWYFLSWFIIIVSAVFLAWDKRTVKYLSNKGMIIVLTCIGTYSLKFFLFPTLQGRFYISLFIIVLLTIIIEWKMFMAIGKIAYSKMLFTTSNNG